MTKEELDAWADFGPEWDLFKVAWLGRGLHRPPSGTADDPQSQRGRLWKILDARPTDTPRWIREAPKKLSARAVVGYVFDRVNAIHDAIDGDDLVPPRVMRASSQPTRVGQASPA